VVDAWLNEEYLYFLVQALPEISVSLFLTADPSTYLLGALVVLSKSIQTRFWITLAELKPQTNHNFFFHKAVKKLVTSNTTLGLPIIGTHIEGTPNYMSYLSLFLFPVLEIQSTTSHR
jgi:hypothetical protein